MSAKPRPPIIRAVKTPEALTALRAWLDTLGADARRRGEAYFTEGRVSRLRGDADHYFEATVNGSEPYTTTLFLTRGKWSSKCTCAVGLACKHAYAAGRAWIAAVESGLPDGADPVLAAAAAARPVSFVPVVRPAPPPPAGRTSFPEKWSPLLAQKLGRPLTDDESHQLVALAAVFAEFQQTQRVLFPGALLRHGFEHTPAPGTPLYAPAFEGWWDEATAPADPWALWQYIAYDYERAGREIPAVFRPLTDTRSVRTAIAERLTARQLAEWRRALAPEPVTPLSPAVAPLTVAALRARITALGVLVEFRAAPGKPWKSPSPKWYDALAAAVPADLQKLPAAEAALAVALCAEFRHDRLPRAHHPLPEPVAANLLRTAAARPAFVLHDGTPFAIEPEPLVPEGSTAATTDGIDLRLVTPDGHDATAARLLVGQPEPLWIFQNRVWRGPPPLPPKPLPLAALTDTRIMSRLRAAGLRLPPSLDDKIRRVVLRPVLQCWLAELDRGEDATHFRARLFARADDPPCEKVWSGGAWQWSKGGAPSPRRAGDPLLEFDVELAQAVTPHLADFRLGWHPWADAWARLVTKNFPEDFVAWHATLPPGLTLELSPELASLLDPPLHAQVEFSAAPAGGGSRDWFDLTVALRVQDTKLTPEEVALLLKARGKWVRLAGHGWRRLELAADSASEPATAALDRLGLSAADVLAGGKPATHRLHALQLAGEADTLAARHADLAAQLRARAAALVALPPPPLPAGLRATLRPYQQEGFHFLAHLSALGFGGILADDMGLGKTVQALAWLLHLAAEKSSFGPAPSPAAEASPLERGGAPRRGVFRALIVCPKSVMHGWLSETERFAPSLHARVFNPLRLGKLSDSDLSTLNPQPSTSATLVVANYAQLRLQPDWFRSQPWDAIVLDEAQFVKNPSSQTAVIARSLQTAHRLALTGTPIENRLLDLWSLFAFAQPGLLGQQAAFRRQYPPEDPAATARLRRRTRHFLLRRTKAQVAPELPPRTEDEIVVDLESSQRRLYDAELKRARAQLLGIDTNRALDAVRFNVLASLLRLRQICCHPALISDAHADMPSAKIDALLERLEELRDEGQQVLVFSQFVSLLEIIRTRLAAAGIAHLMLTGATENRAELVDKFQSDRSQTVFLLSLKAAGTGLNLTAASYVVLCDPWWNPAVEAQAIDRTHRIGQTQPVVAYRLVAADTIEQKILAMQREKAALASAVVQEESLASLLDLDSLREILA